MDVQDQIYLISGVTGGVYLVLLILVIVLFVKFSKLRKQIQELGQNSIAAAFDDGDLLEKRGYSEYTTANAVNLTQSRFEARSRPSSIGQAGGGISRQHSTAGGGGYGGSQYQSQPTSPVGKAPYQNPAAAYSAASSANLYSKSYDNPAFEREQTQPQRQSHRERDMSSAGGVRVLPSSTGMEHQSRRNKDYDNSGYY